MCRRRYSIDYILAVRVYRGQKQDDLLGEEALLSWDKFPYTGLSKVLISLEWG